jgi:hypothetical protein
VATICQLNSQVASVFCHTLLSRLPQHHFWICWQCFASVACMRTELLLLPHPMGVKSIHDPIKAVSQDRAWPAYGCGVVCAEQQHGCHRSCTWRLWACEGLRQVYTIWRLACGFARWWGAACAGCHCSSHALLHADAAGASITPRECAAMPLQGNPMTPHVPRICLLALLQQQQCI